MKQIKTFREFKAKALQKRSTPFPILFIEPFTIRLAYLIQKITLKITPTHITIVRLLLLSPLIMALLFLAPLLEIRYLYLWAAIFFYIALFTDWLDGELARGTGRTSNSGAFLDSIGDRFGIIIFFVLVFSIGMWNDNFLLIYGAILLFSLKTTHMIIVTMMFYYDKGKEKSKNTFFAEGPARQALGITKVFSFIKKIHKYSGLKRWDGEIEVVEQYVITIIGISLLMYFNIEPLTTYLLYFFIIFYSLFYLFRIIPTTNNFAKRIS